MNAGAGTVGQTLVVKCLHESCRDMTALDMIGKMIADQWFDRELLDDESYNAAIAEDDSTSSASNEGTSATKEAIRQALASLTPESGLDDVKSVLQSIADADLPRDEAQIALTDITEFTGGKNSPFKIRQLGYMYASAEAQARSLRPRSAVPKRVKKLIDELSQGLGRSFSLPSASIGQFTLEKIEGKIWVHLLTRINGECVSDPIATPFVVDGGITYEDRGGERALRIRLLNQNDKWVLVDIKAQELASASGNEPIGKLMAAGLAVSRRGRDVLHDILLRSQARGPKVYDTPGYRDGAFICPTGEVLLTSEAVELSDKTRLKCAPKNGSLEKWREATSKIFEIENCFHFHTGILLGFSGALASLAGDEMLAYDLDSKSTAGKSTTQMLAAGAWAVPGENEGGLFVTANGTKNTVETRFEIGSGTVAAFDEVGGLDPETQREIPFMVQGGSGKRRADREGNERKARRWYGGCYIGSSETEFSQRLRLGKVRQAGGLAARQLTITVTDAAKVTDEEFGYVNAALKNFGWSGPEFVKAAAKAGYTDRDKIKTELAEVIDKLERTTGIGNEYRRRAARQVGYPWLAGQIAAQAGLIPASFELEALAKRLWSDFLKSDSGPTEATEKATDYLIDQLRARRDVEIISLIATDEGKVARQYREAFGYYDEDRVILRASKFSELSGGLVGDRVLRKHLLDQNILIKDASSENLTWSYWPGVGKGRFVVLDRMKIEDAD